LIRGEYNSSRFRNLYEASDGFFPHTFGSDLHVVNHLFDDKTLNTWQQDQLQKDLGYKDQSNIRDQGMFGNGSPDKNYVESSKARRRRLVKSLRQQNMKNYILINIPLSDLF
jgi:hypothetical protein